MNPERTGLRHPHGQYGLTSPSTAMYEAKMATCRGRLPGVCKEQVNGEFLPARNSTSKIESEIRTSRMIKRRARPAKNPHCNGDDHQVNRSDAERQDKSLNCRHPLRAALALRDLKDPVGLQFRRDGKHNVAARSAQQRSGPAAENHQKLQGPGPTPGADGAIQKRAVHNHCGGGTQVDQPHQAMRAAARQGLGHKIHQASRRGEPANHLKRSPRHHRCIERRIGDSSNKVR